MSAFEELQLRSKPNGIDSIFSGGDRDFRSGNRPSNFDRRDGPRDGHRDNRPRDGPRRDGPPEIGRREEREPKEPRETKKIVIKDIDDLPKLELNSGPVS